MSTPTEINLLNSLTNLISSENWLLQIFCIVVVTLLTNYLIIHSLQKIEKQVQKTENVWDDALLLSAYVPIRLFGWLIGLTFILAVLHRHYQIDAISSLFYQFRKIAFIFLLSLFVYKLISNVHSKVILPSKKQAEDKLDPESIEAIAKLLKLSVVIVASLTILQILGYSISGILAFGGMGGIAVGFAAKDLLANFFGGLMIYLDKPFKVGDWVRSPDREIEGYVENIGWRISRIRTFEKRPLYIPNSLFANIIVENPSRMSHRRISENIGIRYDDWKKMPVIVTEVKAMLQTHPSIDTTQTIICNFNAFNDSSIDLFIYTFTKTTNWVEYHQIKEDILFAIFNIIDNHGAEIAFPTQTLLMKSPENFQ